jgi:hypothetical protein
MYRISPVSTSEAGATKMLPAELVFTAWQQPLSVLKKYCLLIGKYLLDNYLTI